MEEESPLETYERRADIGSKIRENHERMNLQPAAPRLPRTLEVRF